MGPRDKFLVLDLELALVLEKGCAATGARARTKARILQKGNGGRYPKTVGRSLLSRAVRVASCGSSTLPNRDRVRFGCGPTPLSASSLLPVSVAIPRSATQPRRRCSYLRR
jgi:hypothetical protein